MGMLVKKDFTFVIIKWLTPKLTVLVTLFATSNLYLISFKFATLFLGTKCNVLSFFCQFFLFVTLNKNHFLYTHSLFLLRKASKPEEFLSIIFLIQCSKHVCFIFFFFSKTPSEKSFKTAEDCPASQQQLAVPGISESPIEFGIFTCDYTRLPS